MNVASLQPHPHVSDLPPEQLAHNQTLTEQEKIGAASRQFEAILLRQILEASQKTVIPSKFADTSTAGSVYRDMVTSQLADSISKSGAFGLAQTFEHQLTRRAGTEAKAAAGAAGGQSQPAGSFGQPGTIQKTSHGAEGLLRRPGNRAGSALAPAGVVRGHSPKRY